MNRAATNVSCIYSSTADDPTSVAAGSAHNAIAITDDGSGTRLLFVFWTDFNQPSYPNSTSVPQGTGPGTWAPQS